MPGFLKSGQLVTGQTGLIYKGSDGTGRIITPDNYQPKGNYAAANHNHNGVYQPAGSYAAANHNHSGVYQPVGSYATTAQLNELKTSVSNGKSAVASAITDKGVSTSATASFNTMANNIRNINQGLTIQYIGELYTRSMPAKSLSKTYSITGYLSRTYSGYLGQNNTYTIPFTKFISMRVYDPYWSYGSIYLTLESGEIITYFTDGYGNGKFTYDYSCYLLITNGITSTIKNELASIGFNCYTW